MNDLKAHAVEVLQSRAARITFYEDRAEVTRVARAQVGAGTSWVALAGVTPVVDDRTVQAKVEGEGVEVLSARVSREVNHAGLDDRRSALERDVDEKRAEVSAAIRTLERAQADRTRAQSMCDQWARALGQGPSSAIDPSLARWRTALALATTQIEETLGAFVEAEDALDDARLALEKAALAQQSFADETPQIVARVEVQIRAQNPTDAAIEIRYRTPCALWRPEHLGRLVSEGSKHQIELVTYAAVWQRTGEDWQGVDATFSTARPAAASSAPKLDDDVLWTRRKTEEEQKTIDVEARDQEISLAGLASGTRAVEEMPGVDDGGEPLSFRAQTPMHLPSDGEPTRLEIERRMLDARVSRVLIPEVGAVAHLSARATVTAGGPILAGPVRIIRGGGFMGRSKLDFSAAGEPFEMGFGPDDGLRVRRKTEEKRDRTPVIGTQKLERKVELYISNLSDQERTLEVTERVPVSEIEQIEISLLSTKSWDHVNEDGFLKQRVTIKPRSTHVLELAYEVRAKSNVQLPF